MPSKRADTSEDLNLFDVPAEAPPAYDDVNPNPSSSSRAAASTIEKPLASLSSSTGHACRSSSGGSQFLPSPGAGPSGPPAKVLPATITLKVQNDIHKTIQGLVLNVLHDITSGKLNTMEAIGVLDSCANACMSHSLSFASILQETSIEGRSAVYWSIVSKSSVAQGSNDGAGTDGFLLEFLSRAAPLSPEGVSELRAACLAVSDNTLFQRLRSVPGLIPLSGPDRMLLAGVQSHTSADASRPDLERMTTRRKVKEGTQAFKDQAHVHEGGSGPETDSFRVDLQLRLFQRRMRVSGSVAVEFIARGRVWLLTFFVVPNPSGSSSPSISAAASLPSLDSAVNGVSEAALEAARGRKLTPGSWAVALAILDESMQCYARTRLIITAQSSPPDLLSSNTQNDSSAKPPIILNLASSGSRPLTAMQSLGDSAPMNSPIERIRREHARSRRRRMAQGTWEDQQESARLAGKVLFSGIENTASPEVKGQTTEMAKAVTQTTTKTATRKANTKTKKADAEPKAKRAPSAYNNFMSENLKSWKEKNPDKPTKEGMSAVAALWRESPLNPKRGQAPAESKAKAKKVKADKENVKKPRSKKAKPAEEPAEADDE
ncbi:hypothetical protein A7U60_g745 [Sanghuangporus baumii]|uniref:YABBY protein C-terminal domain-containing protein n=1 Tax=Sanghuangporus baumii TaxID=108892 RepID=A0A9Q5I517_SANBA|nr:hypothetical protein A7U60_g745 [Sanghuangporus baumii]